MSTDPIADALGIDMNDPTQRLACHLVANDDAMIGALVRLRLARRLPVAIVAERMGTTADSVRELEAFESDPRLSTLRRYALALGARITTTVTKED